MPEVVGDDGVDVGQHQRIIGAEHVFRRHAVLVLVDDQVEADPTLRTVTQARALTVALWVPSGWPSPLPSIARPSASLMSAALACQEH
jgi:hypothetical protein